MINLRNESSAVIVGVIELSIMIKTHSEKEVNISRSDTRRAHIRVIKSRLENPELLVMAKLQTNAQLNPGAVYSDQQGVLYVAYEGNIIINVTREIGKDKYDIPTRLLRVAKSNISSRTQLEL